MIKRIKTPKKRPVVLVCDYPVLSEINEGESFSSISNTNLFTALRTGRVDNHTLVDKGFEGIQAKDIFPTYLDYTRFNDDTENFDYLKEIKKKKDLHLVGEFEGQNVYFPLNLLDFSMEKLPKAFFKLEHQKDVYVSYRLWQEIQALVLEIRETEAKFVIVTGKWSLFVLHGGTSLTQNVGTAKDKKPLGGLNKFRASVLPIHPCWGLPGVVLYPMYHTLTAMSMPDKKMVIEWDIGRACYLKQVIDVQGTEYLLSDSNEYVTGKNFGELCLYLEELEAKLDKEPTLLSVDIETMHWSMIDCVGLAYETDRGCCIPFAHKGEVSVWTEAEEAFLIFTLSRILTHVNARLVFQNGLYDLQYFHKFWCLDLTIHDDTMVLSHVLFNHMPKNLAFLASLFCTRYKYWKDDVTAIEDTPETRWVYNIKDCCYTLEVLEALSGMLEGESKALQEFYAFQVREILPVLINMMNLGIKVDLDKKDGLTQQLTKLSTEVERKVNLVLGLEINLRSPKQIQTLFTDLLGIKPVIDKKRKTPSFGSDAMLVYLDQYPIYKALITLILEYRSINVFVKTFLSAKVDDDGRMRCSYNVAGTKSYRLSSRKNVFGSGCLPIDRAKVLTPTGWQSLSQQPPTIMQYDNNGILTYVKAAYFITDWDGELISYSGRNVKGEFTPEHRIPVQHHRITAVHGRQTKIKTALEVSKTKYSNILTSGLYHPNESRTVTNIWLQKLAMLSADGHRESKLTWRVSVKKDRKKERIFTLFSDFTVYKDKEDYLRVKFKDEGFTKEFPIWLLEIPLEQRKLFIEEVSYWDSHRRNKNGKLGSFIYYTTIPHNAEVLQTLCHISDYSASITIDLTNSNEYGNTSTKPLYSVCVSNKIINRCESFRWFKTKYKGEVGCPIVPSGMWLMKYDNEIHITGNCNLANIPSKGKIDLKYSLQSFEEELEGEDSPETFVQDGVFMGDVQLPNCKELFIPDEGYSFFNVDYSGADAMIVAWESDCVWLKNFFKTSKEKLYVYIVREYLQREITTSDPFYKKAKQFIHLSHYGGMEEKAAMSSGLDVKTARELRQWYFYKDRAGEVLEWQKKIAHQVATRGWIENIFGARFWLLDRNCKTLLNQAYALIPQSTIAVLCNKAIVEIYKHERKNDVKVLMQIHDAVAGLYKTTDVTAPDRIAKHMMIELPYKDPLIIPVDVGVSEKSYGDCG